MLENWPKQKGDHFRLIIRGFGLRSNRAKEDSWEMRKGEKGRSQDGVTPSTN